MPPKAKPRDTSKEPTAQDLHKALSHELRGRIWTILSERNASPAELARELGVETHTASYHVDHLVKLGIVEEVASRPVRGATEHFYRAVTAHFVSTDDWNALPEAVRRSEVGQYFQAQLDAFTTSAAAGIVGRDQRFHLTRTPFLLDEQGVEEGMDILEEARKKLRRVGAESLGRLSKSGQKGTPFSSAHAFFEMPD